MKEFFRLLNGYIKRSILSPVFFACTAICTLMLVFFVAEYIDPEQYSTLQGLHYFLSRIDGKGSVYLVMMITAFPATSLFYDDWKSGKFKFIISRAGRLKYTFSVTIAAGVTASAVMILSYIFFSIFILSRFPVVSDVSPNILRESTIGFPNSGLLYTGHAFLCYFLYYLTRGAMAAFFAVVALLQSMLITNKHLTVISPVLIYIIYFSFNLFYILPALVNPFVLFKNGYKLYLVFGGTQDGSLFSPVAAIYPLIFLAVIMTVFPLIEAKILRYKMNKSI